MEKNLLKSILLTVSSLIVFFVVSTVFIMLTALTSKGQSETGVDNFRGVATIRIPLIDLKINEISDKVVLKYEAQSLKVTGNNGNIARGWSLDGEGSIERILKGLPDEKAPGGGDNRSGWMFQTNYTKPLNFTISDDNNDDTCTDEAANYAAIHNTFGYTNDSEPDWFVVNAPGLKCKLILDNTNKFRVIPEQDIKIEFINTDTPDPRFIITNSAGTKYTFTSTSKLTKHILYPNIPNSLFNREYEYYKTPLTYINTWYLDKITSPGNDYQGIEFTYREAGPMNTNYRKLTTSISTTFGQSIQIIRHPEEDFIYGFNINETTVNNHKITLNTAGFINKEALFLKSITETSGGCSSDIYQFEYYGCDLKPIFPTTSLPALDDARSDAWGNYYSEAGDGTRLYVYPTIGGFGGIYRPYEIPNYTAEYYNLGTGNRIVNEETLKVGVLSKITYPSGGSTAFEYESNSFWDPDGNAEIKGAGIRIKTRRDFDGINPDKPIVTSYTYNVPGQSRTSGTVQALPKSSFTTNSFYDTSNNTLLSESQIGALYPRNSADYWRHHSFAYERSENLGVQYEYVTVRKNTEGRTEYKYNIPSNFWSQDINNQGYLASTCNTPKNINSPLKKGYNQFPFAPKENKDYASALLLEEKSFSETNVPVKTVQYEYEDYYTNAPVIYGLAFDRIYENEMFCRYGIQVNAALLKKEKETIYDNSGGSRTVESSYDNSASGRQVRTKTVVNSDNSVLQSSYTYSGDFTLQPSDVTIDPFAEGLYLLNQKNMKNVVVEQLIKRKEPGATDFKVYEGQLSLFKKSPLNDIGALNNVPVLSEVKTLTAVTGLSGFNGLSVTNGLLTYHNNYRLRDKFEDFDNANVAQLITSGRNKKSTIYGFNRGVPIAEFYGAALKNIAFDGFDGSNRPFRLNNNDISTFVAGQVANGSILPIGDSFNSSLIKADGSSSYTISLWIKSANAATVNVLVNNLQVTSFNVSASDNYVFYQKQINVSGFPDNMSLKLTASQTVHVDEIVFCPSGVSYLISGYNFPYGKAAETTSSGKTMYYEYDSKGRPTYTRDGDRNIIKFNKYQNYATAPVALVPYFNIEGNTFITGNDCLIGVKYKWDFGDGTVVETFDKSITHQFAPGYNYTVTLTASHPEFGTTIHSNVYSEPMLVTVCAAGIVGKDVCGIEPSTYGDCSSAYPAPVQGAMLYVSNIVGCPGQSYSYEWEEFINGNWVATTSANSTTDHYDPGTHLGTRGYRCKVTSNSCGVVGYSNSIGVNYYQSQPNCPVPDEN